jgi:ADP-ribosylglycohydrolase
MSVQKYSEKIYAGILGKIIGVYMGRPVEGWSYEAIRSRFGTIDRYVAPETGAPFIVPDDDISGTFVFYRALEDNGYPQNIAAEQIGEAWLNYIVENTTVLWWGGLARSTEHSAFLRLKAGIKPPLSGSSEYNGRIIAEQIGSQIFIDTWAMVNPGNPSRAAKMARQAALVSHDGIAVEAAVFLAALEAMAFDERDIDVLLHEGRKFIANNDEGHKLNSLLDDIIVICEKAHDWHSVRDWIEENHNYAKYQGNCPMIPNHLAVVMALKFGGDDFRRSISIATSAGWDTDCNAGNVGCLQAIRLGLNAIDADADLREPVADRMFVVSTDGGDCIFDAVQESRKVIRAAAALNGEDSSMLGLKSEKFAFEHRGSTQGFVLYPDAGFMQAIKGLGNTLDESGHPGLSIRYRGISKGITGSISVQTYVDPSPKAAMDTSYFEVYASPSLYSSQIVKAVFMSGQDNNPDVRFFIDYYDQKDAIATIKGEQRFKIGRGETRVEWEIPETNGRAVYRLGMEFMADSRCDGELCLKTLDWKGSPRLFHMGTAKELTPDINPFITRTKWMMAFMNSTKNTGPDYLATLAISHPEENGVMTIGSREWDDYTVASTIQFVHAKCAGLVARSKGHRRYYAAVFSGGKAHIIRRRGGDVDILAEGSITYQEGDWHDFLFKVKGVMLSMYIDDREVCSCTDDVYASGGAGFMVSEGAIVAKEFTIKRC